MSTETETEAEEANAANESKDDILGAFSVASPIILGITGHRHLPAKNESIERIKRSLCITYRAFSSEKIEKDSKEAEQVEILALRRRLGFPEDPETKADFVTNGLPVHTPIWILSPMADGADILAAITAHNYYKENDCERPVRFVAPLATPWSHRVNDKKPDNIYNYNNPEFIEKIRGKEVDPKSAEPFKDTGRYHEFVLPLGGRGELRKNTTFPKNLPCWADGKPKDDGSVTPLNWDTQIPKISTDGDPPPFEWLNEEKAGKRICDSQFGSVALYVSLYSHVVIALWDGQLRGEESVGADSAVRAKIQGPSHESVSHLPIVNWADTGPVIQILTSNFRSDEDPDDQPHPVDEEFPMPDALRIGEKPLRDLIRDKNDEYLENHFLSGIAGKEKADIGDYTVIHPDDSRQVEGDGAVLPNPERYDATPKEIEATLCNRGGRSILSRIFRSTVRFNQIFSKAKAKATKAIDKAVEKYTDKYFEPKFEEPLFAIEGEERGAGDADESEANGEVGRMELARKLRAVSANASSISKVSIDDKNRTVRRFSLIFLFVAFGALLLDLYVHWYAEMGKDAPVHHTSLLIWFVGIILSAALYFYCRLHHPRIESSYLEMRALAEAVRIQVVWMASGLPQSVPLHYLQRHRGAFDWIRNTVSAWCFPYEDGQRCFDALPLRDRIDRLKHIKEKWITDQRNYFEGAWGLNRGLHHNLHHLGVFTAAIGMAAGVFLMLGKWAPDWETGNWGRVGAAIALTAGLGCGMSGLFSLLQFTTKSSGHGTTVARASRSRIWTLVISSVALISLASVLSTSHLDPSHPREMWPEFVVNCIYVFAGIVLVAFFFFRFAYGWLKGWIDARVKKLADSSKTEIEELNEEVPYSWWETIKRKIDDPRLFILPGLPFILSLIAFALLAYGSIFSDDAHHGSQFPYILVIGLPLLLGALIVAWGEKMLHSEHANRYFTAGELFRLTNRRLADCLHRAEVALDEGERDEETAEKCISEAQEILFELGKEALTENAEWLLLHRARPLEFPMAG